MQSNTYNLNKNIFIFTEKCYFILVPPTAIRTCFLIKSELARAIDNIDQRHAAPNKAGSLKLCQ